MSRPLVVSFVIASLTGALATTQVSDGVRSEDERGEPLCRSDLTAVDDMTVGSIGGRVLDASGKPLSNVLLSVFQRGFSQGRRELTPASLLALPIGGHSANACTDSEGRFVVSRVLPGNYYLAAFAKLPAFEVRTAPVETDLVAFLYPGVADIDSATVFTIAANGQSEITFTLRLPSLTTVRGIVVNAEGAAVRRGDVVAMPRGEVIPPNYLGANVRRGIIRRDGRFTIENLLPGDYSLRANIHHEPEIESRFTPSPFTTVRVTGRDVANIRLTQPFLATVSGRVSFDQFATRRLQAAEIQLVTREWNRDDGWLFIGAMTGPPPYPRLNSHYSFAFETLPGAITLILAGPNPHFQSEWRLKSIRHNGVDMTDQPLQLPEGGLGDVEVELTNRYARVDGRLQDPKAMTSNARVLLFARDRARWRLPFNQHFAVAVPTRHGSFTAVLPPGDYYAAAVQARSGMEWQDPEFLTKLIEHSTTFSAALRDTVSIVVR